MMKCALVFGFVAAVMACAAEGVPRIADELCALRFEDGRLVVSDRSGADVLSIGKVPFCWSKPVATPKTARLAGDGRLRIAYEIANADAAFPFGAEAYLTGHGFAVDFASRIPDCHRSGGQMVEVMRLNGTERDGKNVTKCGYWKRAKPASFGGYFDPGVPFEVSSMKMKPYRTKSGQVFWCRNCGWQGNRTECPGFPRTSTNGIYRAHLEFVTGVDSQDAQLAAAEVDGRPFAMALSTARPFNIFEGGIPSFRLTVKPLVDVTRELRTVARDFDGKIVFERRERVAFRRGRRVVRDYALAKVANGERGIWFVESTVSNGKGEDCFCRMNLAVLPPHRFEHRGESVAAMSSHPENSVEAERLMERLGVAIIRNGDNRYFTTNYGITAYAACHAPPEAYDGANPKHRKILEEQIVGKIRRQGNPYFEFGNEVGWHKTHEEQARLIDAYASWLRVIRSRLREEGLGHVKVITFGIQPDYSAHMMGVMKEKGVFDLVDGLTLHPGRGYYTADWTHGGWVFRGIIQRARKRFADFGYPEKEIHMTECYAATHPNDGWKDSQRQAAENTLLSLVVATVEPHVRNMMFYKLHQGTSQDPHGYPKASESGITTVNAEYDFGLLMRDDSPKPSLLAYAATCEHLDGAKFVGEKGEGSDRKDTLRCFAFDSPRGKLSVLFDRSEGGMLFNLKKRKMPNGAKADELFRHSEPWVKHWSVAKEYSFKVAGEVRAFDMIGRSRPLEVRDGKVSLSLDGEPVFVYGIDTGSIVTSEQSKLGRELSEEEYAAEERNANE